jgi:hypothetical protein
MKLRNRLTKRGTIVVAATVTVAVGSILYWKIVLKGMNWWNLLTKKDPMREHIESQDAIYDKIVIRSSLDPSDPQYIDILKTYLRPGAINR